jgi:ribosome-associated protein
LTSRELADRIIELAQDKKGRQIVRMELGQDSSIADYFVIISGDSDTHCKAVADNIEKELRNEKLRLYHKEGYQTQRWILLDYVDVIVHIFRGETREFYGLERLWGDAKMDLITEDTNVS